MKDKHVSVRDSESVWTAVEKCAARDGSVHEWPAARVHKWVSARGGQIAKKFDEAKDIDGAALMRLRTQPGGFQAGARHQWHSAQEPHDGDAVEFRAL